MLLLTELGLAVCYTIPHINLRPLPVVRQVSAGIIEGVSQEAQPCPSAFLQGPTPMQDPCACASDSQHQRGEMLGWILHGTLKALCAIQYKRDHAVPRLRSFTKPLASNSYLIGSFLIQSVLGVCHELTISILRRVPKLNTARICGIAWRSSPDRSRPIVLKAALCLIGRHSLIHA